MTVFGPLIQEHLVTLRRILFEQIQPDRLESRPRRLTTFVPGTTSNLGFIQSTPLSDVAIQVYRLTPAMYHNLKEWSPGSYQTPSLNGMARAVGGSRLSGSLSQGRSAARTGRSNAYFAP